MLFENDLVVNGVTIELHPVLLMTIHLVLPDSSDTSASGIAITAAINRSTEQTGVIASVDTTEVVRVHFGAAATGRNLCQSLY